MRVRSLRAALAHPVLVACLAALMCGWTGGWALSAATPSPASRTLPDSSRGPRSIAFTPGGAALVVETDSASLAVIERSTGRLLKRIALGEKWPEEVTTLGDEWAVVTCPLSGQVLKVDFVQGKVVSKLRLLGEPSGTALRDDKTLYIALSALDQVAVIDVPSLTVRARVSVGRRPRAIGLTPDRRTLLAAGLQDGSVSVIDTDSLEEARRLQLRGINLRGLSVSPDGRFAYVTGQVPTDTRVTWVANDVWVNTLFQIDLTDPRAPAAEGRLDTPNFPCPDPEGVAALPDGRVALAATGSDEAVLVQPLPKSSGYFDAPVRARTSTGAQPRAVALSPDRREVWVSESIGSAITVLDAQRLQVRRRITLPAEGPADPALQGRYLFANAGMTAGRQFTCSSCHPDGRPDGQTWQFVHVPDGVPERNTRSLRGGVAGTAPFRWSGRETEIGLFLQDEVEGLLHGHPQPEANLTALARHLESLPVPPNPHRNTDGSLTEEAERGRALFIGKAGCMTCHSGVRYGGTGKRAYVGTTQNDQSLDIPHLQGVYDTGPYLHDGRASSLEAIFSKHNGFRLHGKAHALSQAELSELLAYVRSL